MYPLPPLSISPSQCPFRSIPYTGVTVCSFGFSSFSLIFFHLLFTFDYPIRLFPLDVSLLTPGPMWTEIKFLHQTLGPDLVDVRRDRLSLFHDG
ncbi:hypothetical protein P170DRAFT_160617 [Aspergillus steynii IBT 23096]|uniref:Uncharacterized protein n=1 Tax=Aspergillus steynii IBT 23096 TaxID=1392250 RepID=A0A2I2GDY9_9EURO|nr:uncharacterized protein P170DRAFT_160617 [Aspergillus steynii IBT 23096]PLB51126.1 hypothetical protein P170DRAFT_160617 [Aspergillus steynii IBT 23096]